MATAPVSQFSIEDDDRPKKPQQQAGGGFTIGDITPVKPGPSQEVLDNLRRVSAQKTDFEKQNEMGTAGRLATNAGLGIASGASGLPETMHPVRDAITGLIPNITQPFSDAAKESLLSGATSGGVGTAMDIYNTGKELLSGRQAGESDQDVADRRAHAVGTVVGKVAPIAVGEGVGKTGIGPIAEEQIASAVRTPNNTPRLGIQAVSKYAMPHWIMGEGIGDRVLDNVLPMRTATDTAGRPYTPPNPTQRIALENDARERTDIMDRTRQAEEAKAQDVHATNELNRKAEMKRGQDIDATNKLNEQAAADAAAKKAAADKQFIRENRAVPLTRNPSITPEKIEAYDAGRQQMTPEQAAAAKNPVIPSIITPQTPIEATQFSEGRPATWTNESLPSTIMNREAPMAAKRSAIQQMVLRNRPLPENARYLAGDANFSGVGSNPKSTTLFRPDGTPIDTTPSPLIQPIEQPRPGAGIPRITDMADEYLRSLGEAHHPEVENVGEESGPNASGESAASREAISRNAAEKARGEQRFRIDTRSGQSIPLIGVDAVDAVPGEHDVIVKRGPSGEVVIDRGAKARYPVHK